MLKFVNPFDQRTATLNTPFAGHGGIDVSKFVFLRVSQQNKAGIHPAKHTGRALHPDCPVGGPHGLRIALEPTGGCEWGLWDTLERAGFEGG